MNQRFVLCDVFSAVPFAGNPLAVFLGADDIEAAGMAALAREFGWSEITFVLGPSEKPRVRIWTPFEELPFAGHPTVGTSVVLVAEGLLPPGVITVELGIGDVRVEVDRASSEGGHATMTQRAPEWGEIWDDREGLARGLSIAVDDLGPDLPAQMVSTGIPHFMVPIRSIEALGRVKPVGELLDPLLAALGARWAYVFTVDTPESDAAARARLVGRGFEDAATGSAAGPLGAYLVQYGLHEAGAMAIEQGVEIGRPSRLEVEVPFASGEIGEVRVGGEVRIWGRGNLDVALR